MKRMRVTVDVLAPPCDRPGDSADEAVAAQAPVTEWYDVLDWYDVARHLQAARPLANLGLMYGHQERDDDAPYTNGFCTSGFPFGATTMAEVDAWADERDRRREAAYVAAVGRVDEFIAGFDFHAYGLARVLGHVATR